MKKKEFGREKFRGELERIMPGYNWTIHKACKFFPEKNAIMEATGIQSSGFNRTSTLHVHRMAKPDRPVIYTAKSSGFGRRSPWLAEESGETLAQALRALQDYYQGAASQYAGHAGDLRIGRKKPGGPSEYADRFEKWFAGLPPEFFEELKSDPKEKLMTAYLFGYVGGE